MSDIKLARELYRRGDFDDSMMVYEKLYGSGGLSGYNLYLYARLLLEAENFELLEALYLKEKSSEFNNSRLWRVFAEYFAAQGRWKDVARACEQVVRINSEANSEIAKNYAVLESSFRKLYREHVLNPDGGTATLCAIFKNEGPYIVEWVAWHSKLGFSEIVIYDNNSDDESPYILKRLAENGYIKYREWPDVGLSKSQHTAYRDAMWECQSQWIMFLDADEFLYLEQGDILDVVAKAPKCVGSISFNWKNFGSSGHVDSDGRLVVERFVRRAKDDFKAHRTVKSISRVSAIQNVSVHVPTLFSGFKRLHSNGEELGEFVDYQNGAVFHFIVKSRQEFEIKKKRGNALRTEQDDDKYERYQEHFFLNNDRNDVYDDTLLRHSVWLKDKVEEIKNDCSL